jgi:hypothetical protein
MTFNIVSSNLFKQMQSYKTLTINQKERQQMKHTFIDRIKNKVSLRWNRAKKLQQVIDEIIYKATDRGYSFNGRETLAKKCNVSLRTVDKAIKVLKESNEVVVAYRHNPSSNGYKTPIFILKHHEYFKYWKALLNLEDNVECEVEKYSNTDVSTIEGVKKVYTYSFTKSNININNHLMNNKVIKFVPQFVNKAFSWLGDDLLHYWKRVLLASKVIKKRYSVSISKEQREHIGLIAIGKLKEYIKQGVSSLDEQLKLVFSIALKQFEQMIKQENEADQPQYKPMTPQNIVRYEKLPEWFGKEDKPVELGEDFERKKRQLQKELGLL